MAAGGRRPGAGRPRGVTAGTKHARLEKMLGKGSKTPLEYMLNILNDKKTSPEKRCGLLRKLHHLFIQD